MELPKVLLYIGLFQTACCSSFWPKQTRPDDVWTDFYSNAIENHPDLGKCSVTAILDVHSTNQALVKKLTLEHPW